ncbi:MAG TPA: ferrochelatase, partial [bacterium]|nr:ferrochelatase [bacterium]
MATPYEAVLLIAFGGPDRMADVRPFLANVLRGRRVPPERVEEVVHHYERFDGHSPLTELTVRQAEALRVDLSARCRSLPVYVGMRNWTPYLHESLARMRAEGIRRALGIVMAAHRSYSSWEQYHENVAEARAQVGPGAPEIDYLGPWFDHPGFIEAQADRVADAFAAIPAAQRPAAWLIFTAHSIPEAMAATSPYVEQLTASARLVAARLDHPRWSVAYQSRSGDPRAPWLGPDVTEVIRGLGGDGTAAVVVVPIGFVCDHIEVLYDLDTEAREAARQAGVAFHRAGTVLDHPAFVRMLGDL